MSSYALYCIVCNLKLFVLGVANLRCLAKNYVWSLSNQIFNTFEIFYRLWYTINFTWSLFNQFLIYLRDLEALPYIHTYKIGLYNHSVRTIDLVSYTTYVTCVNFIQKWRNLEFKVGSKRQILLLFCFLFWENFHGNFIYSHSLCQKSPKEYFLYFVLIFGRWLDQHTTY